jgi:hypothetical protein
MWMPKTKSTQKRIHQIAFASFIPFKNVNMLTMAIIPKGYHTDCCEDAK